MTDNIFDFIGGDSGQWQILSLTKVTGEPLELTSHLKIIQSTTEKANNGLWVLKGVRSNLRYTESDEKARLTAIQADLGRPEATRAALIPIKKKRLGGHLRKMREEGYSKQNLITQRLA